MHVIIKCLLAILFCTYGVLWIGVDFDYVKSMLNAGNLSTEEQINDTSVIADDIFDKCKLVSGPIWTDYLRKQINSQYDPIKSCNHSYVPWSELASDGQVQLTEAPEGANCRARAVLLKSEYSTTMGEWHEIRENTTFRFENDFVEVECSINNTSVYNFLHHQIWRNTSKIEAASGKNENVRSSPSVYIIVIDSIGASHGRRAFNKTHRFLKEEFGAIEFQHMNKVGENSRPNGHAFLLGKMSTEIRRDMFGMPSRPADWNYTAYCETYLDDKGFILQQFEKNGYVTMMAEDWTRGVFNWPSCIAFKKQPTTHYMRPFQLRLDIGGEAMKNTMSEAHCYEPHLYLNEYLEKFINAYPDTPKASLLWPCSLGHDSLERPFHADAQFKELFERNKEEFDNSFVFFMGDHGMRFGWYSQDATVGQRDVNNPMLMISVPRKFRSDTDLMSNLKQNSGELLTMFDTHATFIDIVENFAGNVPINFKETANKPELLGSSLFRPLPDGPRNCKTLPIPTQYCLCEIVKEQLNITDEHKAIGQSIVSVLNDRLIEANATHICATLELDKITQLKTIVGAQGLYEVIVQLRPGGGIFETYVRGSAGNYSVIAPDITRSNKYEGQADCMNINELRPFCYCKNNLLQLTSTSPSQSPPKR